MGLYRFLYRFLEKFRTCVLLHSCFAAWEFGRASGDLFATLWVSGFGWWRSVGLRADIWAEGLMSIWEFPKIRGTLIGGPYNKDPTI